MAPLTIRQNFELALQHHQAGRLPEAEQLYWQILAQQPEHIDAMNNLGVIAHQLGRNDIAVDLIRRGIALRPNTPQAHNNLGVALRDMGQLDEAIAAHRQAIALKPDFPEAHNNLGNALNDQGLIDEAITAFRQAITLKPGYHEAHNNLGNALRDKGELDEAITAYRQALSLRPDYAEAHSNLGNTLRDKEQFDEAIAAYRHALALRPDLAEVHRNLGLALGSLGQLDEAVAAYRQAIALRPNYAQAYSSLGAALKDQCRLDEAIAAWRRAIALKPNHAQAHSNLVYSLHFHPAYDARAVAKEHRHWNRQHAEPLRKSIQRFSNDRDPDRRLRIGYVSPDFRGHVVGWNLLPLFREHNRRRFDIICYAQVACPDSITSQFQQFADRWRNIVGLSDEHVAEQIREDRIDVLVDLALHMADNRLLVFAQKPAPVQTTFAGYPSTTGLDTIEFRLSDPYLDPPGMDESVYSEKTIRLPDSFWCYDPSDGRELRVNPLPALETGVITFGCLNNLCKVNDSVLALWAQVLRQVEKSRLMFLAHLGSHRQRITDQLRMQGIDPGRIEIISPLIRRQYLELYHRVDLGLDSFPYNGHTTSLDSFWMGVPVVTLVGQTAVSRAGWCQLSNLGLTELAGKTEDQFVRIAVELATDLPRLAELRSTLRPRMEQSPLMDAPRFARNVEAAYRQMWHTWCGCA